MHPYPDAEKFPSVVNVLVEADVLPKDRILAKRTAWQGSLLQVEVAEVELAHTATRATRELVPHPGGAAALVVRDGLICLVAQYRVSLGRTTLELPAGRLDAGEDSAHCALRELAEETGLQASAADLLVEVYGSPGFTPEKTSVFWTHEIKEGSAHLDDEESVQVVWLPVEEVLQAILAGVIKDGKTVSGVLAARVRGIL